MHLRPFLLAALCIAAATSSSQVKPDQGNYVAITAGRLKAHLEFVSHDLLEGRNTPSRGLDIAAEYIATQMKLYGLQPGGTKGSYFQEFPLPGSEGKTSRNVIAILKGADPKLSAEYVAIGSHYDHVGLAEDGKDRIFNGADDDGSGTVAMLEMAHAMSRGPKPKRSILFVWHAGEEHGLWGSEYFTNNPTVPIKSIVAQLNIDMIGRSKAAGDNKPENKMLSGPNSIYVIGSRRLSTELGNLVANVNRNLFKLEYNYHYDQPYDPENLYFRSDHYSYARLGIPIAFFFDGVHEDYHQVGDEAHKIDYKKLEKISQTICVTAWNLANRPNRPKIDGKIE